MIFGNDLPVDQSSGTLNQNLKLRTIFLKNVKQDDVTVPSLTNDVESSFNVNTKMLIATWSFKRYGVVTNLKINNVTINITSRLMLINKVKTYVSFR